MFTPVKTTVSYDAQIEKIMADFPFETVVATMQKMGFSAGESNGWSDGLWPTKKLIKTQARSVLDHLSANPSLQNYRQHSFSASLDIHGWLTLDFVVGHSTANPNISFV